MHKTVHVADLKPGRLIIVGDIHGCVDELHALLDKVDFSRDMDNLIFAGDLVNKGPSSVEVSGTVSSSWGFSPPQGPGLYGGTGNLSLPRGQGCGGTGYLSLCKSPNAGH